MNISKDATNFLNKIQHTFMIKKKTLLKVSIDKTYLNKKAMYDKPTANDIINGEMLKILPLRSRADKWPTLTTFVQHSFESPSHSNQRRKGNKRNPNWKGRIKTAICNWHDTVHRKF